MDKIEATLILEILGRPAEHIKSALTGLVDRLGSEKGIKIIEKKIHEPLEVKETKNLYTAFAEVSVEFDSLANYFGVIFAYMPAHIEIISPVTFKLSNAELNELGNKLLARLHDYDAITKRAIYERNLLNNKLREVAPHLFKKSEENVKETNIKPVKNRKKNKKSKKK
ncbi:MAG: hypothetical protein QXS38_01965 [Candidatus Pacearchaeota archaeon]